jgi:hypothetical protein
MRTGDIVNRTRTLFNKALPGREMP